MAEKEKARISNEIQIFTNVFSKKKTLLIEKVLSLGLKNSMHQPAEKGDKKLLVKLKGTVCPKLFGTPKMYQNGPQMSNYCAQLPPHTGLYIHG